LGIPVSMVTLQIITFNVVIHVLHLEEIVLSRLYKGSLDKKRVQSFKKREYIFQVSFFVTRIGKISCEIQDFSDG